MIPPDLTFKLAYGMIPLFWPMWLAVAAAAVWVACHAPLPWRSGEPIRWRPALAVAALFIPYALFLIWGSEFAYHDNEVLTEYSAAGKFWPVAIWPHEGRYFPLFGQEFNVIGLFAPNAVVYHSLVALQLLGFCWLVAIAMEDLPIGWRIAVMAVLVLSNSVGIVFADLIYPERHIVFWLTAATIALQRMQRTPSRMNLLVAWLSTHIALYYKEPVFIFVATAATARLTLSYLRDRPTRLTWLKTQRLELGFLALSAIFAVQLVACLSAFGTSAYVERTDIGVLRTTEHYLRTDPLLIALFATVALRASRIRRVEDVDPVWDSLAAAAIVFVISLGAIGLAANRYMPPADLIAALYVVRQAAAERLLSRRRVARLAWAGIAAATVLFGLFRLVEYKAVVRGTASLERFLDDYASSRPGEIRLHFPGTKGWRIANLATYLRYRNRPLFERVRFSSPESFPTGRCVVYVTYARCSREVSPPPDSLLIHLPDDTTRGVAREDRVIFRYELVPGGVPGWVGPLLYPSTELYDGHPMPPDWLSATASLP